MNNSTVKEILEKHFINDEVKVTGDGYHYLIVIISDVFNNLSKVKRTQKVYQALGEQIQSGEVHALTVKAFTSQEWSNKSNG